MIDTPSPAVRTAARTGRWRRWWWVASMTAMALALAGTGGVGGHLALDAMPAPTGASAPIASASVLVATPPVVDVPASGPVFNAPGLSDYGVSMPSPDATADPASVPADPNVLTALPGPVPAHGPGTFDYVPGSGAVLGTAGPLKTFRVAVERGIDEDFVEFAADVESTLANTRSWVGGGSLRLRRVPGKADFTVYLVSRDTAAKMCRASGTDIREDGTPYTSCRTPGKAIVNLDRWRLSARPYVKAKIPLAVYRQYVINHEVGHELGHHHQGCPKKGGPAPVMVQQTLSLRGCVPNAWPRSRTRWLSGPPVRG